MAVAVEVKKESQDRLEQKFFQLLDMDPSDKRFLALYDEVHRAIDAEMALNDPAE